MRLATIAIRRWGIDDHQPAILQVKNQYVIDYLVNEVLVRQPPSMRSFLLKSSILDRFCAPLCAAFVGSDSLDEGILSRLEEEGLFIESLDSQKEWYRFHQLFREILRQRLEAEYSASEVTELRLRASNWLAANGFIEDALDQALKSGEVQVAVNILAKIGATLVDRESWLLLESLLNKFPSEIINREPYLLLLLAWLKLVRMQLGPVERIREYLQ
ncbi:MAG: hypothetical protein HC804_08285, partial [Anaerolineae bacterium]|nr:hypothetical protein [Anaerolineae bacterium]